MDASSDLGQPFRPRQKTKQKFCWQLCTSSTNQEHPTVSRQMQGLSVTRPRGFDKSCPSTKYILFNSLLIINANRRDVTRLCLNRPPSRTTLTSILGRSYQRNEWLAMYAGRPHCPHTRWPANFVHTFIMQDFTCFLSVSLSLSLNCVCVMQVLFPEWWQITRVWTECYICKFML